MNRVNACRNTAIQVVTAPIADCLPSYFPLFLFPRGGALTQSLSHDPQGKWSMLAMAMCSWTP
jgi:hypothetical protein